ncbi:MAG: branched-chain amino acid ABC transporter permease [Desulfarculaceae bacterium]|nr:branched-chain amino acid ABC transporter permease [Desulfarculaceae bacterium]MCF8072280.1 branched-chain amino acid ABC transporter permease [Desulfarculaceae bacterium]MCF8100201.1 branched-chain amino acid ABC transporter permease [Desulfarculaceae bacterium]MCF8116226.1 branched-chain amino acid ABC transporter permease [Desulfarculaceae bacterium]
MPCGLFFETYQKDESIFPTLWVRGWMIALGIFLLAFPFFAQTVSDWVGINMLNMFILIFIFLVGAHGLNLLTGYTGQISLGHGAFMGVGAYTAGILANLGWPFWICLPAAGVVTAGVGMIFGIPSLRLRGLYLAIATLAAQFILVYAMRNWEHLTGGSAGLLVPTAKIGNFEFDSDFKFYFLALAFAIGATMYLKNVARTRTGRAFVAVRDRYLSAEVIGVNLFKYRIMSFGISSFMVGTAGGLWAFYITIISDEHFTLWLSVQYLAMCIVGGLGQVLGSIFGVIFMVVLPEVLRIPTELLSGIFPNISDIFASLREMVFGIVVILFLIFEPDGMAARWHTIRAYWKLWPFSY